MSLLSILLPAGAAVIKIALRLADPSAPNVADTIDDFTGIYSRVADEVHRRRLIRQAQDMADEVSRRLARELEAEYHGIDDHDLLPAVGEVVSAVNSIFPLNERDRAGVVGSSDPPTTLFRMIESRGNVSAWERQHGERVSTLAHSILRDACHATVAIIRKHPELTIDMLAMLSQRSEDLARVVDDVRESVTSIPHRVAGANAAAMVARAEADIEEFTVEYLRSVASRYDQLELYGLDLEWEATHYSLTTSYISLRLGDDMSSAHHSNLGRALDSKGVVYLRGPAGSGKTTILQWLAVGMARRTLPAGYGRIASRIPVVVRLRNYTDSPLPMPTELAKMTAPMMILAEPAGWLRSVSRRRGVVLLIDGVDEFPDERRGDLLRWLNEVAEALTLSAIVIAGRPSAEQAALAVARRYNGATLDIQPMSREEIRSFVLHWHTSLARKTPRIGTDAFRVAETLCRSREYRSLAATPLLCAALCALFHAKKGSLPGSRIAIYETLIRLLLAQRDEERGIQVDNAGLDVEQRRLVLEELAMFMLSNNLSEVDVARAIPVVQRALTAIPSEVEPDLLLRKLIRRSGVIREPADGKVDFVHRAFLEFLAARAHVELDTVESIAARADDQNYADAAILAGGLSNVTQFASLVSTVLAKWDRNREPQTPMWLTRLAAGLLAVRRTRAGGGELTLVELLERSLPPESEEAIRAIVSAGESLFAPLLDAVIPDSGDATEVPLAGALIRSLGDHGGEAAFAALGRIPPQVRLAFLDDLLAIWSWFDLETFARDLLADLAPSAITPASISTSRVFPYLRMLSSNFRWHAVLPFPDVSLADDCVGAPIDLLDVGHVDVLDEEVARRCDFVLGLASPRQIAIRKVPVFSPQGRPGGLTMLEGLRVELVGGGDVLLEHLVESRNLNELTIVGGTIKRPSSGRSDQTFVNHNLTLSLLDGAEAEKGVRIHARSVKLRNVDSATAEAIATSALIELEVRSQTAGFDLDSLSSATGVTAVRLRDCRDLENFEVLASLPALKYLEISGNCRINDVDALLAVRSAVETVVIDPEIVTELVSNDPDNNLRDVDAYDSYAAEPESFDDYPASGPTTLIAEGTNLDEFDDPSVDTEWSYGDEEPSDEELRRIEGAQS